MSAIAPATPDPRRWWTLVVLCFSLLVIGLDNTILNVALPTLQEDLDASASQLQWIVDSYMLVFAAALLTAGALGDRFGRRKALTFGLIVFGLGSGLSALAGSSDMLIATRALMGIGGAFIMPSTLSILTNVFPAHERGKAIGIWAAVSGLGIVIGPVTGGWLVEHGDWSLVFLVNLPFVLAALVAGRFLVPESRDPAAPRLDVGGFLLSSLGLGALVASIIEAPDRGWTSPLILTGFALAASLLAAFVAWELRSRVADARRAAVPQPPLLRGERGDRARVLRPLRDDLLPHAVPADGHGLHRVRERRPDHARRRRPDHRRPALGEAGRADRDQARRRPPACCSSPSGSRCSPAPRSTAATASSRRCSASSGSAWA